MEKRIYVTYKMVSDNCVTHIPVRYEVEEDTVLCLSVIRCHVDLPGDVIPAWLAPRDFEITTHYRYGFHVTDYNDKEVKNIDAEFFRYKAYADILLQERLYSGPGNCQPGSQLFH